jgi:CrcB protein
MIKYLIVFFGSGLGGGFRYWLSSFIQNYFSPFFPYGTLGVNIIGSFILGYMIFGLDERELISPSLKLFIGIGFCGGFTTFSTFSLETFNLLRNAEFFLAALNILLSLTTTIACVFLAYLISR